MSDNDAARVVCTDWQHTAIIIDMLYPFAQDLRENEDACADEIDCWCELTYGTPDALIQLVSWEQRGDQRWLHTDRRWCLFAGRYRFRDATDALAFKMRWS